MIDSETKRAIVRLCDAGFSSGSAGLYKDIDALLAAQEQTKEVTALRRMTVAGPQLSSKRFIYPHIKDRILDA